MIMVTKVIGWSVSSQTPKLVISNPLSKKKINKMLVVIEITKCDIIKMVIFLRGFDL